MLERRERSVRPSPPRPVGHTKANARVAENFYRKATGEGREAVVAAIFWLKTRAGWRETNVHELSGPAKIEISWQDAKVL